jgi:spore germination cell wall hydrolase CwlJ-like protein
MMQNIIPQICKSTVRWISVLCAVSLVACTTTSPDLKTLSIDSLPKGSIFVEHFEFESVGKRTPTKSDRQQLECLAQNVYYESAQETYEGLIAVAQVTMNRVADGRWGKDVCTVVHYRSTWKGKTVCQFSWTCERKAGPGSNKQHWERAQAVAGTVYMDGYRIADLKEALYFHARHVNPRWNNPRIRTIGNHMFYGEKK